MDIPPQFTRKYSGNFIHSQLLNHDGRLVGFALKDDGELVYTMMRAGLSQRADEFGFDSAAWLDAPRSVPFPKELTEVGTGRIAPWRFAPEPALAVRLATPPAAERKNTGRLTAKYPFVALSHAGMIFLFRQSVADTDANKVEMTDISGASGTLGKIVNNTLLLDRLLLLEDRIVLRREVRYRRSGNPFRAESQMDTLGSENMSGEAFFEPTRALTFLGSRSGPGFTSDVSEGRFTVNLLPTAEADRKRWVFSLAMNKNGKAGLDTVTMDVSKNGLFDTAGRIYYTSPDPDCSNHVRSTEPGICPSTGRPLVPARPMQRDAKTCLYCSSGTYARIPFKTASGGTSFGTKDYTIELWFRCDNLLANGYIPVLTRGNEGTSRYHNIYVSRTGQLIAAFSEGANWNTTISSGAGTIQQEQWYHIALTSRIEETGEAATPTRRVVRMFVNGRKVAGQVYDNPNTIPNIDNLPVHMGVGTNYEGKANTATQALYTYFDEVRFWDTARNQQDIAARRYQALSGDEANLVACYRFDEGSGTKARSLGGGQTADITITDPAQIVWRASSAPIAANGGLLRQSTVFDGNLAVSAPPAARIYFQHCGAVDKTSGPDRPSMGAARMLLTVPVKDAGADALAVIDRGISSEGRLASPPDSLALEMIDPDTNDVEAPDIDALRTKVDEAVAALRNEEKIFRGAFVIRSNDTSASRTEVTVTEQADGTYSATNLDGIYPSRTLRVVRRDGQFVLLDANSTAADPLYFKQANQSRVTRFVTWNTVDNGVVSVGPGTAPDKLYPVSLEDIRPSVGHPVAKDNLTTARSNLAEGRQKLQKLKPARLKSLGTDKYGLSTAGGRSKQAASSAGPEILRSHTGDLTVYGLSTDKKALTSISLAPDVTLPSARIKLDREQEDAVVYARNTEHPAITVTLTPSANYGPPNCMVTIVAGSGTKKKTEVFHDVPLDPRGFVRVLNGEATDEIPIGKIKSDVAAGGTVVSLAQKLAQKLPKHATIGLGGWRMRLSEQADRGSSELKIYAAPDSASKDSAVFLVEYNYDLQAYEVPTRGSALVRAVEIADARNTYALDPGAGRVRELPSGTNEYQLAKGENCAFVPAAPDYALKLSGKNTASSESPIPLPRQATIEAWMLPDLRDDKPYWAVANDRGADTPGATAPIALGMIKGATAGTHHVVARLGGKFMKSTLPAAKITPTRWCHVAYQAEQAFALRLRKGFVAIPENPAWNVTDEMTLQISVRFDKPAGKALLIGKGYGGPGMVKQSPFRVFVDSQKRITFECTDDLGQVGSLRAVTSDPIDVDKGHLLTLIRRRVPKEAQGLTMADFNNKVFPKPKNQSDASIEDQIKADYHDAKAGLAKHFSNRSAVPVTAGSKQTLAGTRPEEFTLEIWDDDKLIGLLTGVPSDVATSRDPILVSGLTDADQLSADISAITLFDTALDPRDIGARAQTGAGAIADWRFSEGGGVETADRVTGVTGVISGTDVGFIHDNVRGDPSLMAVRVNGVAVPMEPWASTRKPKKNAGKFVLGDAQTTAASSSCGLDEVRVWSGLRTVEEIHDLMFTREVNGHPDLLATYSCDYGKVVADNSGHGRDLNVSGAWKTQFVVSEVRIGPDAPFLTDAFVLNAKKNNRSIYTKNPFMTAAMSATSVVEYSDLQIDARQQATGVLKRAYSYLTKDAGTARPGAWVLATGFKVGDLITTHLNQVPFRPQVKGFVEGAPPIPVENLTEGIRQRAGHMPGFVDATSVKLNRSGKTRTVIAGSAGRAERNSFDFAVRAGISGKINTILAPIGFGISFDIEAEVNGNLGGSFSADANASEGVSTALADETQSSFTVGLSGQWETAGDPDRHSGQRRWIPDNTGLALVEAEVADVYSLSIRRADGSERLISYRYVPNPDIPRDTLILTFPINPYYTKAGTLDGKTGFETDKDYPQAGKAGEWSYFKPREAYAMERRIEREEQQRVADYTSWTSMSGALSGGIGGLDALDRAGRSLARNALGSTKILNSPGAISNMAMTPVAGVRTAVDWFSRMQDIKDSGSDFFTREDRELAAKLAKRDIVNTYVWTASGGFFAESSNATESFSEITTGAVSFGGNYSTGFGLDFNLSIGVSFGGELTAMQGGQMVRTKTRTQDDEQSYSLDIALNTPGDLSAFLPRDGTDPWKRRTEGSEAGEAEPRPGQVPVAPQAKPAIVSEPGKVDAYRFKTFLLQPQQDNTDQLFNRVVDPVWLQNSTDATAAAMRAARPVPGFSPASWRIFHRVTYVSRILPKGTLPATTSNENRIIATSFDSHEELRRRLTPLFAGYTTDRARFRARALSVVPNVFPGVDLTDADNRQTILRTLEGMFLAG